MLNTTDYRNAPSGEGPQAGQWKDKPHRLIYDLCNEIDRLRGNPARGEYTQYGLDRFYDGAATGFGSSDLPHSIRPGQTGEIVVAADGFQVVLPTAIVTAIAAIRNDPRWGVETDNCRK